uniref:Uncharacterized protein n=1 Tax=Nelumbo nucifera TaxID=4432 RepID=A0A822ZAX2_NELNU|nr:TPA_asm: hypothetical protein HUJ06_000297 [Nelumbo nucifera]
MKDVLSYKDKRSVSKKITYPPYNLTEHIYGTLCQDKLGKERGRIGKT